MKPSVPSPTAARLVESVIAVANLYSGLAERRQAVLEEVADLIGADAGWWAWGRGHPTSSTVVPLAQLSFGFTPEKLAIVREWGLDQESDRTFRRKILEQMGGANQLTSLRCDIFSDAEWHARHPFRALLARAGWNAWVHCVRYSSLDTWSNFFLTRNAGRPDFSRDDCAALDLTMSGVTWMHSGVEESLPPATFVGLTPRQRTVMLMLLDGAARKTIARQLGIAEDTVGDHIKSIYGHFKVGSSTELAALFLRAR
jgi:DNA-binding CsgD family transcriptional regulator